jgi:hypothetical protein
MSRSESLARITAFALYTVLAAAGCYLYCALCLVVES